LDRKYLLSYVALWDLYYSLDQRKNIDSLYALSLKEFPETPIFKHKYATLKNRINQELIKEVKQSDKSYHYSDISEANYKFMNSKNQLDLPDEQLFGLRRVQQLTDRIMIIKRYNSFGAMDISGNLLIPMDYDTIFKVNDNHIAAIKRKVGMEEIFYYNFFGKLLNYLTFESVIQSGKFFIVRMNANVGLYTNEFKEIFPLQYNDIKVFDNFISAEDKGYKWGCYEKKSKNFIPHEYNSIIPGNFFGVEGARCDKYEEGKGYIKFDFDLKGNLLRR